MDKKLKEYVKLNKERINEAIKSYAPETLDVNKIGKLMEYIKYLNDKKAK